MGLRTPRRVRIVNAVILSVWCSILAHAEEPEHKPDIVFWSVVAGSHVAAAYDIHTTLNALSRCVECREQNPLMRVVLGGDVAGSSSRVYRAQFIGAGMTAAGVIAARHWRREGKRYWWVGLVAVSGMHVGFGMRNQTLH